MSDQAEKEKIAGSLRFRSISGSLLLPPLAYAVAKLTEKTRTGIDAMAHHYESSWAISAIVSAVIMFESFLGLFQRTITQGIGRERVALTYYNNLRASDVPAATDLVDVTEVFVVRDALVHNHVWEVEFDPNSANGAMLAAEPLPGFGDAKWRDVVDMKTGKTKQNRISVIYNQMDRSDAYKVLRQVVAAMHGMVAIGALIPQCLSGSSAWPIGNDAGKRVTLDDLVTRLRNSIDPKDSPSSTSLA